MDMGKILKRMEEDKVIKGSVKDGLRYFSVLRPFALFKLPLRIKAPELRRVHAVFK